MTDGEQHNKEYLRWEVKPVWFLRYPSELVASSEEGSFQLYGVDRGGLDIVRNWEKINSVEQFNQGFVAKPTDFTFTIAIKERGRAFERFRRLAKGGILFDIRVDLLRYNGELYGDRPEDEQPDDFIPWLDGFEGYLGCIVQREGQTVELASFPVREFECEFLRHRLNENAIGNFNTNKSLTEGDGTYPNLSDLSLDL